MAQAAFSHAERPVWETRMVKRQTWVRALYHAQARMLSQSADPADQALAAKVEAFVKGMPQPDSQRLALAQELRMANAALSCDRPDGARDRDR